MVDGLYNIKPEKFSVAANPLVTLSNRYGKEQNYWDGADFVVKARPRPGMFFQGGVSTGRRVTDNCDVVGKVDNPSPLYCHREEPLLTQVKGYGSYTLPRVDVQLSATYQTKPGPSFGAVYTATNAEVSPSLGRNLAGGEPTVDVPLVSPVELEPGRLHQIDFRVSKLLRLGGARARVNLDIYNALNGSAVLELNNAFDDWQTPSQILSPGSSSSARSSTSDASRRGGGKSVNDARKDPSMILIVPPQFVAGLEVSINCRFGRPARARRAAHHAIRRARPARPRDTCSRCPC